MGRGENGENSPNVYDKPPHASQSREEFIEASANSVPSFARCNGGGGGGGKQERKEERWGLPPRRAEEEEGGGNPHFELSLS